MTAPVPEQTVPGIGEDAPKPQQVTISGADSLSAPTLRAIVDLLQEGTKRWRYSPTVRENLEALATAFAEQLKNRSPDLDDVERMARRLKRGRGHV